jgi:hypothetical protein
VRRPGFTLELGIVVGGGDRGQRVAEQGKAFVVERDTDGLTWIKSSFSGGTSGSSCLELATDGDRMVVRCSRDRLGVRLTYPRDVWTAFVAWVSATRSE